MKTTYKELCIRALESETEQTCHQVHAIIKEILTANRHLDRGLLCEKLHVEAAVFNHLVSREDE